MKLLALIPYWFNPNNRINIFIPPSLFCESRPKDTTTTKKNPADERFSLIIYNNAKGAEKGDVLQKFGRTKFSNSCFIISFSDNLVQKWKSRVE